MDQSVETRLNKSALTSMPPKNTNIYITQILEKWANFIRKLLKEKLPNLISQLKLVQNYYSQKDLQKISSRQKKKKRKKKKKKGKKTRINLNIIITQTQHPTNGIISMLKPG